MHDPLRQKRTVKELGHKSDVGKGLHPKTLLRLFNDLNLLLKPEIRSTGNCLHGMCKVTSTLRVS